VEKIKAPQQIRSMEVHPGRYIMTKMTTEPLNWHVALEVHAHLMMMNNCIRTVIPLQMKAAAEVTK